MAYKKTEFSAAALAFAVISSAALSGCGGDSAAEAAAAVSQGASRTLSPAAKLGDQLFSDTRLSVSGQQACATCHVPSHAYTSTDGLSAPLGGPGMNLPGLRNAPSLVYASFTPPFSIVDGSAVGGFFRDGRASSLAAQASQPFVTPFDAYAADRAPVARTHPSRSTGARDQRCA